MASTASSGHSANVIDLTDDSAEHPLPASQSKPPPVMMKKQQKSPIVIDLTNDAGPVQPSFRVSEDNNLQTLDDYDIVIEEEYPWSSEQEMESESDDDADSNTDDWFDDEYSEEDALQPCDRAHQPWKVKNEVRVQVQLGIDSASDDEYEQEQQLRSSGQGNGRHLFENNADLPTYNQDSFFPFLKLPLELREKICSFYLQLDDSDELPSTANILSVYRTETHRIDARPDTDDNSYLKSLSLRQRLASPLLQTCHLIREEALACFWRHSHFIICSIPDLNLFVQAIGPHGRLNLRHIQLYDPFYCMWSETVVTQVLHTLATSCMGLKTFCMQLDEEDMLFPTLRDAMLVLPEQLSRVDGILQHPRISALRQLRSNVKTSFKVDFSAENKKVDNCLKDEHQLEELPHWLARFYMGSSLWRKIKDEINRKDIPISINGSGEI